MYNPKSHRTRRETIKVHKSYLDAVVYVCDKKKKAGGVYGSCHLKDPCGGQVLGFDTLTRNDAFIYIISIYRVYGMDNHDLLFILLQDQHHLKIIYLTWVKTYKNGIMYPHYKKPNFLARLKMLSSCNTE